jgi:S-methylmethionine-dependent homocysteine/selenocysteine methylase
LEEGVSAILFNCCEPETILIGLRRLAEAPDIGRRLRRAGTRLGAYANRLTPVPENFAMAETTAPQAMRADIGPAEYAEFATQWVELGAELVGGCCGIGPEYIDVLRKRLVDKQRPTTGDRS